MPHSHNDPGWLKTVEGYFATATKNILNNIVNKLTTHTNMTFIWSEVPVPIVFSSYKKYVYIGFLINKCEVESFFCGLRPFSVFIYLISIGSVVSGTLATGILDYVVIAFS